MSSNGNVDLTNSSNDIDLDNKRIVDNFNDNNFKKELIKVLELGLERIGSKFLHFRYEKKDRLFHDIGYCFIGLASELISIKNDLKK